MSQNAVNQHFQNNSDGFEVGGGTTQRKLTVTTGDVTITGGGSAVITFPSTTSILATLNGTETLTNKTLTAPVINSPTGIVKGDVGLGSVDNVQQLPMSYLDTDGTLAANSDAKVPSQKAVRTYVASAQNVTVASNSGATYNDTATAGQKVVLHDSTAANITHNLPTAVGNVAVITIKKTDSSAHTITVDGNSTETIDGGTTAVLQVQYEAITLVSDNANWNII